MNMRLLSCLALFVMLSAGPVVGTAVDAYAADPDQSDPAQDMSAINLQTSGAELEKLIVDKHPLAYLFYAQQLWSAGRGDEAVFWYYVGQLRFRFQLETHPHGDPTGDPALYAALKQTIGAPINLHAGGDPDKWARQIDEALRWDSDHPNGFTSKTTHAEKLAEARGGLTQLRDWVVQNKVQILAEREQHGIGANGLVDGVYVEEKNEKMPRDWPALVVSVSLEKLAGTYADNLDALLGPAFFDGTDDPEHNAHTLQEVELRLAGPETVRVIGRFNGAEVLSTTIFLRLTGDAAVFEYTRQRFAEKDGVQTGGIDGTEKYTIILHQNTAGELVLERKSVTEGRERNVPVRYAYTFWNRARRLR